MSAPRVRPRLVHLTTTDMSLDWLLRPQLLAFADAGYEVFGVSAPGPHVEALEAAGIRHVALGHATRSMAPADDVRAFAELHAVLRQLRPTIVHTHNPKPGIYGRVAARATGTPIVVNTVHGLYAVPDDPVAKRVVVYGLERLASACSQAELVQNREDLETLARIGVPRSKLHLLGNGVDLARFDPERADVDGRAELRASVGATDDDIVVGLVGRLVAEKGYREVFAAARLLRDRRPHIRFVVIGPDDPDKADAITRAETDEVAATANVTFLGARTDVDQWYTAMDLYLLASHREGFPRSAMEAGAMGLPVVTSDIRGCREVVVDGRNGYLVPARDPIAIAEAVASLADDAGRRAAFSRAARDHARAHFDQQAVIDLTLGVYERLRGTAARGGRRPA